VFWAPGRSVVWGSVKVGTRGHRRWEVCPDPAAVASVANLSAAAWYFWRNVRTWEWFGSTKVENHSAWSTCVHSWWSRVQALCWDGGGGGSAVMDFCRRRYPILPVV
jgi:hypothetical protein